MPGRTEGICLMILLPIYVYAIWRLLAREVPILARGWRSLVAQMVRIYNDSFSDEDGEKYLDTALKQIGHLIFAFGAMFFLLIIYSTPLWKFWWEELAYDVLISVDIALALMAIQLAEITCILGCIIIIFIPCFAPGLAITVFERKKAALKN